MNSDVREKLKAAQALLNGDSTTIEKVHSAMQLVKGVHPRIDTLLQECEVHVSTLEKLQSGSLIELGAERLPENTEEEKKRKKVLLLFIKSWGDLKSEIVRVQAELQSNQSAPTNSSTWWRIFSYAKGPLGIVTVIAVVLAVLQTTAVSVTIENKGCSTLYPSASIPVSIPGFSLPSQPLVSGASEVATIPPLTFSIDATSAGMLRISSLALKLSVELSSSVKDVIFDDVSLLGKNSTIHLSDKKSHTLSLVCI